MTSIKPNKQPCAACLNHKGGTPFKIRDDNAVLFSVSHICNCPYCGRFLSENYSNQEEAERAARTHWAVGAKLKKDATEAIMWEAISQHIKPESGSVLVEVTFYEKDYRRDEDNVQSGIKYILDGLVEAHIVANDTRRLVRLNVKPVEVDKQNPRIEVAIYGQTDTRV